MLANNAKYGFVVPANYNTIGQTVISGDEEAVNEAGEIARAGPFHTEKLVECSCKLKEKLKNTNINKKECKVVKNIDGEVYKKEDDFVEILSKHIMSPVQFTKSLKTMYDAGIDTFIEIGPAKTLTSFVKRMKFEKEIKIININNCDTLEEVIKGGIK